MRPAMLLMLMMLPLPRAAMPGASAATRKYGARTLLANSASKVSAVRLGARPEPRHAGIVHEDVDLADRGRERLDGRGLAEVGRHEPRRAAGLLDADM